MISPNYEPEVGRLKIPLLDYQQRVLRAMLDLESRRSIEAICVQAETAETRNATLTSSVGYLRSETGSGKTVEIMALLAEKRPPTRLMDEVDFETECDQIFGMQKKYSRLMRCTLVIVNKSILYQWSSDLSRCTDLRVVIIDDARQLRRLLDVLKKGIDWSAEYDVVLLKHGLVSQPIKLREGETSRSLVKIVSYFSRATCWDRVVIDDFDLLHGDLGDVPKIPALFTWIVSATTANCTKIPVDTLPLNAQWPDMLLFQPVYDRIFRDRLLLDVFRVQCDPDYVRGSLRLPQVIYHLYSLQIRHDNLIGAISVIDGGTTITEMINSDSFAAAASNVGHGIKTAADLFDRLLAGKFAEYRTHQTNEQIIASLIEQGDDAAPADIREMLDTYSTRTLTAAQESAKQAAKKHDSVIQRVRENLSGNDCPITAEPLNNSSCIVVLRCCGAVISEEGARLTFARKADCPNCRVKVLANMIIPITGHVGKVIDRILAGREDDSLTDDPVEPEVISADVSKFTKNQHLIALLHGWFGGVDVAQSARPHQIRPELRISGLADGQATDLGDATQRKVLIYRSFESTTDLERELQESGFAAARICGTARQISVICARFRLAKGEPGSLDVVLISDPKFAAGMNLQNATDIIFYNLVNDQAIERQIAGRGVRYGRNSNLHIHYLYYENEYQRKLAQSRS